MEEQSDFTTHNREDNDFEGLQARLSIDFPYLIMGDQLRALFSHVAESTNYEFQFQRQVSERIGLKPKESKQPWSENYTRSLAGVISDENMNSAQFTCNIDNDYESELGPQTQYVGIQFQVTPGIDSIVELEGRSTDNLEVMDKVRQSVDVYFSNAKVGLDGAV